MENFEARLESLSDERILQYQSPANPDIGKVLSPAGRQVARTFSLDVATLTAQPVYPLEDRLNIINQIRLVLREYFVHLDMKIAQFGFDPVRALDRLEPAAADLSDDEFHQDLLQIITRTRDRHLVFWGRDPNGVSAVLPFDIERCWINDAETFVVTRVDPRHGRQNLAPGAIVTHWNGTPIGRQIRLNANLFDAGNEPALLARSMEFLTRRPLYRFAWPSEAWVVLSFEFDGQSHEERYDWEGFDVGAVPLTPAIGRNVIGFGGDIELFHQQLVKRAQFAPQSFDAIARENGDDIQQRADGTPVIIGNRSNFDFGSVTTAHGTFGYFRLHHFQADDLDDILHDFIDAFRQIPQEGLIIDMRGNAGGRIAAGERLLQLFTPRRITPTRFQFRVTPGTRRMMAATDSFERWAPSFEEAHLTGEEFSQGYPIEGTDDDANQVGQRYFGPVVVVTDALAFSTADMFTAGFIDHGIGRVICIDKNMAAAGGNNWDFNVLRLFAPDFLIDGGFRGELDNGTLSPALKAALHTQGTVLSDNAAVSGGVPQYGGRVWTITDGSLVHLLRDLPWMSNNLAVYPHMADSGLGTLPSDLYFGFTVRRCVRTGPNEGRLLEDLGIRPDVIYRPTLRDILGRNQDLLTRATLELQGMPAYRLDVSAAQAGSDVRISIQAAGLSDLEVTGNGKHLHSFADLSSPVEFDTPAATGRFVINGYAGDKRVARRVVDFAAGVA